MIDPNIIHDNKIGHMELVTSRLHRAIRDPLSLLLMSSPILILIFGV